MNARVLRGLVLVASVAALTSLAHADAPAGRYTISGGTVYDTKTKLTWQQTVPSTTYAWADAKTYCAGLGATLAGTGWRLPTRKELQTIVDYVKTTTPAIDLTAFPATPNAVFWSATPLPNSTSTAWTVSFINGTSFTAAVATLYNVRCVR